MVPASLVLSPVAADLENARDELLTYLEDEPGLRVADTVRDTPQQGPPKGVVTDVAVVLSGSGVIAGIVRVIQLWLSRDRDRRLRLTVHTGENGTEIELTGEDISDETVRAVMEKLLTTEVAEQQPAPPPETT
ncbi:hypothetical protein AB0M02_28995 [Actinoplanes sp. NPDC051861]|uniref:effector-associated constant component EACC1 n=1 Tax=Actinoplanes sp. NPDC051861 TaxID=3155170 RepID=UPI00341FA79E